VDEVGGALFGGERGVEVGGLFGGRGLPLRADGIEKRESCGDSESAERGAAGREGLR